MNLLRETPIQLILKISEFVIDELVYSLPQAMSQHNDFHRQQFFLSILETVQKYKPKVDPLSYAALLIMLSETRTSRSKIHGLVKSNETLKAKAHSLFARIGICHYILAYQWHIQGIVTETEDVEIALKSVYFHDSLKEYLKGKITQLEKIIGMNLTSKSWTYCI